MCVPGRRGVGSKRRASRERMCIKDRREAKTHPNNGGGRKWEGIIRSEAVWRIYLEG